MENASKFHIGCLNAEIHDDRMISVRNYVMDEGNTLLSDNEIDMILVLHINSKCM